MLTDRQLCLLSSSALEIKSLLDKAVSQTLTHAELLVALDALESSANCIKTEIQHGFEVTDVENEQPS